MRPGEVGRGAGRRALPAAARRRDPGLGPCACAAARCGAESLRTKGASRARLGKGMEQSEGRHLPPATRHPQLPLGPA